MKQDILSPVRSSDEATPFGSSRPRFRGPPRPLGGRHIAFLGGSETFGQSIPNPYPALLEQELGEVCINFGQRNASIDVALYDPLIGLACRNAVLTVIAVTGAANMSNRLYSVHPRYNDRFIKASASLQALYPDVDFSEICFTRHLLNTLHDSSPERFAAVREELQAAWSARMRTMLDRIGSNVVLAWFAPDLPPSDESMTSAEWLQRPDPLFISKEMIESLRPLVKDITIVPPPPPSNSRDLFGMTAHQQAATTLLAPIRAVLATRGARQRMIGLEGEKPIPIGSLAKHPALMAQHLAAAPALALPDDFGSSTQGNGRPHADRDAVDGGRQTGPSERRELRIAVLPFTIIASSEETAAFADILNDDITEALCKCDGIKVLLPPSLSGHQPTSAELQRLSQSTGLAYLVGGTLRVIEGEIRLTVKLLDIEQERYVWVHHYDQPLARSIRMLEHVSQEIASAVKSEIAPVFPSFSDH